jgi:hypothetical protein
MKKMAARDFENLLQVTAAFPLSYAVNNGSFSVPFPFSKVYFLNHMIESFRSFSFSVPTGMDLPSFECIQISHCLFSKKLLRL